MTQPPNAKMPSPLPEKRLINRREQGRMLGGVSTRTLARIAERDPQFPVEIELTPTTKLRDYDEMVAYIEKRKAAPRAIAV